MTQWYGSNGMNQQSQHHSTGNNNLNTMNLINLEAGNTGGQLTPYRMMIDNDDDIQILSSTASTGLSSSMTMPKTESSFNNNNMLTGGDIVANPNQSRNIRPGSYQDLFERLQQNHSQQHTPMNGENNLSIASVSPSSKQMQLINGCPASINGRNNGNGQNHVANQHHYYKSSSPSIIDPLTLQQPQQRSPKQDQQPQTNKFPIVSQTNQANQLDCYGHSSSSSDYSNRNCGYLPQTGSSTVAPAPSQSGSYYNHHLFNNNGNNGTNISYLSGFRPTSANLQTTEHNLNIGFNPGAGTQQSTNSILNCDMEVVDGAGITGNTNTVNGPCARTSGHLMTNDLLSSVDNIDDNSTGNCAVNDYIGLNTCPPLVSLTNINKLANSNNTITSHLQQQQQNSPLNSPYGSSYGSNRRSSPISPRSYLTLSSSSSSLNNSTNLMNETENETSATIITNMDDQNHQLQQMQQQSQQQQQQQQQTQPYSSTYGHYEKAY